MLPLSICIIFKDEEKNLPRLFSSLKPILPDVELIAVDTGSSDNSVKIQKKYTKNIYFYKWNNNFSAARNFSIHKQTRDYVFILDQDDELVNQSDLVSLVKSKNFYKYNTYFLKIRNILPQGRTEFSQARIFRKTKEFKYTGIIHNQPLIQPPVANVNIAINHYGYYDQEALVAKMKNRTIPLLLSQIKKTPNKINYYTQLAQSYAIIENYPNTLHYANIVVSAILKQHQGDMPKSHIFFPSIYYYVQAQMHLNMDLQALAQCYKQLEFFPDYIDMHTQIYSILSKPYINFTKLQNKHLKIAREIYNNKEKMKDISKLPYEMYSLNFLGGKNVQSGRE